MSRAAGGSGASSASIPQASQRTVAGSVAPIAASASRAEPSHHGQSNVIMDGTMRRTDVS
jgi:hypothetical protein